jgi:type I restriction enzyme S subunit
MQMMNKGMRYEKYKDSGAEWLGEIPEYWKSERLASILNNVADRNRTDLPLLSITREKGVILRDLDNEEENHNFIPDDLSNYKVLKKGQFGMNKMKAWQGSYGISEQDGIVSPAYFIFQLRDDLDSRYFHLAIRSRLYISFFGSASDGVRIGQWDLSRERMKNIPFLIPPIPEQTAIAAFLDRKTALIDQAIDIKQKQIELLKERRQILIHKAVTRGLNPNVKLKDSGVEWIGDIPVGWEVKRLKHVLIINNGADYKHVQTDEGFPVIGSGGQFAYASEFMYDGEVVFLGRKGTIDKPLYFNGKFWAVDTMFYAIPKNKNNVRFLYFVATTIPFKFYSTSTALPSMTQSDLNNHKVSLPSIEEQNEIVEYIEGITNKLDTAISLKEQEIEKLKEYKATLINSAVMGKIKVS